MRIKTEVNQRLSAQKMLPPQQPKPIIKREQKLVRKLFERDITSQMFKQPPPMMMPP